MRLREDFEYISPPDRVYRLDSKAVHKMGLTHYINNSNLRKFLGNSDMFPEYFCHRSGLVLLWYTIDGGGGREFTLYDTATGKIIGSHQYLTVKDIQNSFNYWEMLVGPMTQGLSYKQYKALCLQFFSRQDFY